MTGFFHTLIRPDQEENPERALVARAANILQVGEFQLLQLAYSEWFSEDMPEAMVDRLFASYMFSSEVPFWARDYARRVIDYDEKGLLDIDHPAFHRYDADYVTHVPRGMRHFIIACMILATLVFGSVWVGNLASVGGTSILPPYFEADELPQRPVGDALRGS